MIPQYQFNKRKQHTHTKLFAVSGVCLHPCCMVMNVCFVLFLFDLSSCVCVSLFLASTVSALHRNAHIWNASHPLLVNYYCWVTVYSPSMEGKKNITKGVRPRDSNQSRRIIQSTDQPSTLFDQSNPIGRTEFANNDDLFKVQITTFA